MKRPTVGGVTDHERLEKEAKEHREKLEVCCGFLCFDAIPF